MTETCAPWMPLTVNHDQSRHPIGLMRQVGMSIEVQLLEPLTREQVFQIFGGAGFTVRETVGDKIKRLDILEFSLCPTAPLRRWTEECRWPAGTFKDFHADDGPTVADCASKLSSVSPSWQPIETAPKDETPIIIGFNAAGTWIVHAAWWRDGAALQAMGLDFTPDDTGWWSYVSGSVSQEQLDGHRTPTHWIELPDLPK